MDHKYLHGFARGFDGPVDSLHARSHLSRGNSSVRLCVEALPLVFRMRAKMMKYCREVLQILAALALAESYRILPPRQEQKAK